MLGNEEKLRQLSWSLSADISKANLLDPTAVDKKIFDDYAETFYQAHKHKGVTREMAIDMTYDPLLWH